MKTSNGKRSGTTNNMLKNPEYQGGYNKLVKSHANLSKYSLIQISESTPHASASPCEELIQHTTKLHKGIKSFSLA